MEIKNYRDEDFFTYLRLNNDLDPFGQLSSEEDLRQDLTMPKVNPHLNIFLVWDGDKAIGYLRVYQNRGGTVNRHYHRFELETPYISSTTLLDELIRQAEERITTVSIEYKDPLRIRAGCYSVQEEHIKAYERNGYVFNRYYARMDLHDLSTLKPPQVPTGVTIRPYNPADEGEKYVDAFNLGFEGHFEHRPMTYQEYYDYTQTIWFQPQLMLVAEKDGTFIGVSWNYFNKVAEADGYLWGIVKELGVIPEWRGKSLGRALIRHGMLALRDAGSQKICLWVDYANPHGAKQLYYSEGFVDRYIDVTYAKDEVAGK